MSNKPRHLREQEIIKEAVKRINDALAADKHNREAQLNDLMMKVGDRDAHWSDDKTNFKQRREDDGRVCLVVNRLPGLSDQVTGDLKSNMPSCKVHPADKEATQKIADILEGRIRDIEADSDAEAVYDEIGQQCVDSGVGNWRIVTEYGDDNSFQQVAKIRAIHNNFAVIWDPLAQEYDKSDAEWCAVLSMIHRDTYKRKYGKRTPSNIQVVRGGPAWYRENTYTICEYFRREDGESYKIYMLPNREDKVPEELRPLWQQMKAKGYQDGHVVYEIPEELKEEHWSSLLKDEVVRERKIQKREIARYLLSGHEILEDRQVWLDDHYYPIIYCSGKETNIDGKVYRSSVIRNAKESNKIYNFGWSTAVEEVAMTPKAPAYVTPDMIKGFEEIWNQANRKLFPYIPFNPDPKMPGPPIKPPPAQASTAVTEINMRAVDDMRATTNVFDPSMQQIAPDMSGKAVLARVSRSGISNYAYISNVAKSRQLTWKALLRILPKIEDTEMQVRLRTADNQVKTEVINKVNPEYGINDDEPEYLNDISLGRYDATVTIGPSMATQRMEAAENLSKVVQWMPEGMRAAMIDFVLRNFDYHGVPEMIDKIRVWQAKNGMAYMLSQEELQKAGKQLSLVPPQPPNPVLMAKAKKDMAQAMKFMADAEKTLKETGQIQAETAMQVLELMDRVTMAMQGINPDERKMLMQRQMQQLPGPQSPGVMQ